MRIAINGFGRIGRHILRAAIERGCDDVEFVAVNDLASPDVLAHLLKYDSVHGAAEFSVDSDTDTLVAAEHSMKVYQETNPARLPWKDLDVDIVLECTGKFVAKNDAAKHLEAGAKKVLISAPGKNIDKTIVFGVNDDILTANDKIVSNASCTTNCLAPVAKVLHESFGVLCGYMTTVHCYTSDQRLADAPHKDLRRARGAATSMIPTTTGAARAVGLVLPELAGKLDGAAIRVPTSNVSLIDLKVNVSRSVTVEDVNQALNEAAQGPLGRVLALSNEPLVSIDYVHHSASSTVDLLSTQVVGGTLVRVVSWYDNEWGFANRMLDTAMALLCAK